MHIELEPLTSREVVESAEYCRAAGFSVRLAASVAALDWVDA